MTIWRNSANFLLKSKKKERQNETDGLPGKLSERIKTEADR